MIEEGSAEGLGPRKRISGGLAAITCCLMVVAMTHYLWLAFRGSVFAGTAPPNTNEQPETFAVTAPPKTNGQPERFGGITSIEDGSARRATTERWER